MSVWLVFYFIWKIREKDLEEMGGNKWEIVNTGLSFKFWHIVTGPQVKYKNCSKLEERIKFRTKMHKGMEKSN